MKINFIKNITLIVFLNININNILASGHHDANMIENWWSLGSEYSSTPALGWFYVTFLIFLLFTLYYGNKILKTIVEERSEQIKNNINNIQEAKIIAQKDLDICNDNVKNIHKSFEKIDADFKSKSKLDTIRIEKSTHKLIDTMNKKMDTDIALKIRDVKVKLKNSLVDDVISEVISNINKSDQFSNKNYEKKILRNLSNLNFEIS